MTSSATRRQLWAELGIPADYAQHRLPLQCEARRLASIGCAADDGKILQLTPRAAAAWRRMKAAAALDGVTLLPLSAFRSVARQTTVIRRKLAAGEKIQDILKLIAAPGCSEHHTGRALDLGLPGVTELDERFAKTASFRWLATHAATYGFHLSYPRKNSGGIGYEPWHWCWHSPRRDGVIGPPQFASRLPTAPRNLPRADRRRAPARITSPRDPTVSSAPARMARAVQPTRQPTPPC